MVRFQISIPKAGSNLYKQMTNSTAIGLLLKGAPLPKEQFKNEIDTLGRISGLPDGNYCAHLRHGYNSEDVISQYDTVILILRDPRDIIISQLFYVKAHPGKAVNYLIEDDLNLSDLSIEDGIDFLLANIRPVLDDFDRWTNCKFVSVFTFEQFIKDPDAVFDRLHKLGYGDMDSFRRAAIVRNDKVFRRGVMGDWVNYFTDKQTRLADVNFGDIIKKWGSL